MVKTNHSTLHMLYNIQQSATQDSDYIHVAIVPTLPHVQRVTRACEMSGWIWRVWPTIKRVVYLCLLVDSSAGESVGHRGNAFRLSCRRGGLKNQLDQLLVIIRLHVST